MKDEAHSEQAQNILANLAHDLDQIHAKHLTFLHRTNNLY